MIPLLLAFLLPAFAAETAEDSVKYRQTVMDSLGGHMGATSMIVKGRVDRPEDLSAHVRAIVDLSKVVVHTFPESAKDQKSESLPVVWSEWKAFEEAAQKLTTTSEKLLEVVEKDAKDMAAIGSQLGEVGKSCGGCHDKFRVDDDG